MSFDLTAGVLCLDFANTLEDRGRPESEKLVRYADVLAFVVQAKVVDRHTELNLDRLAAADPKAAQTACIQARLLRESIYRVFSARAAAGRSPSADIERINQALGASAGCRRLEANGDGFVLGWCRLDDTLLAPLHPIANSAAELLTDAALDRVRECGGDRCDWLFLDRSRNRSRRWCSMETCGNRSKARRFYHRHRPD